MTGKQGTPQPTENTEQLRTENREQLATTEVKYLKCRTEEAGNNYFLLCKEVLGLARRLS